MLHRIYATFRTDVMSSDYISHRNNANILFGSGGLPPPPKLPSLYRHYLCVDNEPTKVPHEFNCTKFDSHKSADRHYKLNKQQGTYGLNHQHTIVPINRLVPQVFDQWVIHHRLANLFIRIKE
jgi:hypothetical protein